jgi:dipeptidyl aminopeptidase/acylaminoacyl peptidase
MSVTSHESLRAFCSYSHRDEEYLNELRISLRGLERQGIIQWWHDREIPPGWEWEEAIDRNLRTAEVILLLVTPDFMGSDYVHENEIVQAVERHERGEARVIPIIVRPADWEWASFGKLQALPKDAKPITTWLNQDEAWLDVVRGVRKAVEELFLERQMQAAKEHYRKAVEKIWADKWVSTEEAQRLVTLANELSLSPDTAADIERDRMGDTVQAILQRQTRMEEERQRHLEELYAQARRLHQDQEWQAVVDVFEQLHAEDSAYPDPENLLTSALEALKLAQKEDALRQYREGVEAAWTDRELDRHAVEALRDLADRFELSPSDSAKTERDVMGETKEAILEGLERAAKEKERKEQLDALYARARRLHKAEEWQAVVDVLEQIHSEDPAYPDPEGLLESARETLELKQKTAETYDQAVRHLEAEEWPQALRSFEEVQQLESGYRDTEKLLARVWGELAKTSTGWEYADFELEISQQSAPRNYSVAARSSEGEAHGEMHFPFDEWELKDKLRDLEVALLRSGGARRGLGTREEQTVQEFGRALFDALLVGEVRTHYEVSLREARRQYKGMRLRLHVRSPELSALPWEFLYDPERDYLGLSSRTPLVRYLDAPQSVEPLAVTLPLRILGLVASPQGLPQLDTRREKRLVEEAVKELRATGLVELTWLEGETWRALQRAMRHGPWHIFHFVGHGSFDPETEEGAVALSDEEGRKDLLRATALARLLDDHFPLRMAFLNSCEGAKGSESDAFSSTAATLVRRGVPAVVAMQYEVTDKAAIEFSRDFYEAVADGLPVDAAVAEARTAVSMRSALEWGTPVLYMRSSDGHIFDISSPEPRVEAAREIGNREEQKDLHGLYREKIASMWADRQLNRSDVGEVVGDYAEELGLSASEASVIEREVMGDTLEGILERQERAADERPATVAPSPIVEVPDLKGLEVSQASEKLGRTGLKLGTQKELSSDAIPEGLVIAQSPEAGAETEAGSSVSVTVSMQERLRKTTAITVLNTDLVSCLHLNEGHKREVNSVAFSPDGSLLASGSGDRTVRLWRVEDGELLHALVGHANHVYSVAFSPDGSLLASGSGDRTVRLWRVEDRDFVYAFANTRFPPVYSVAFSPDGRLLATGSRTNTVWLWQVENGELLRAIEGHKREVNSVAFSPDGSLLASGSGDRTVRLWRVEDGELLRSFEGHADSVDDVAFSPSGQLLATGSRDNTVRLWQVKDGNLLLILEGIPSWAHAVAFSPDGTLLAAGIWSRMIRLWRVEDGKLLHELEGHTNQVNSVAFSPDGKLLASGSSDKTVRLWGLNDIGLKLGSQRETSDDRMPKGRIITQSPEAATKLETGKLVSATVSSGARSDVAFGTLRVRNHGIPAGLRGSLKLFLDGEEVGNFSAKGQEIEIQPEAGSRAITVRWLKPRRTKLRLSPDFHDSRPLTLQLRSNEVLNLTCGVRVTVLKGAMPFIEPSHTPSSGSSSPPGQNGS